MMAHPKILRGNPIGHVCRPLQLFQVLFLDVFGDGVDPTDAELPAQKSRDLWSCFFLNKNSNSLDIKTSLKPKTSWKTSFDMGPGGQ